MTSSLLREVTFLRVCVTMSALISVEGSRQVAQSRLYGHHKNHPHKGQDEKRSETFIACPIRRLNGTIPRKMETAKTGDPCHNKCVTIKTLPCSMSVDAEHIGLSIGNCDISKWVKHSPWRRKNKRTMGYTAHQRNIFEFMSAPLFRNEHHWTEPLFRNERHWTATLFRNEHHWMFIIQILSPLEACLTH